MSAKPAAHSKTIVFNLLIALMAVINENTLLLQAYLSDGGFLLLMLMVSAVNVYLRCITDTAISFGDGHDA